MLFNFFSKTFYYLAPSIVKGLQAFALIPIITFYFSPKDLGIFYFITSSMLLLAPLSNVGIEVSIHRKFFTLSKNGLISLFSNAVCLDLLMRIFWCLVFFFILKFFGKEIFKEYKEIYLVYFGYVCITFVSNFLWNSLMTTFLLKKEAKKFFFFEIFRIVNSFFFVFLFLFFFNFGISSLFLAPMVANIISLPFEFWQSLKYLGGKVSFKSLRELFKFGAPLIPVSVVDMSQGFFDKLIIQKFLGYFAVGIYGHSQVYFALFTQSIKSLIRVMSPNIVKNIVKKNFKNINFINIFNLALYKIVFFFGLLIIFFSKEFIIWITHGKFVESAPIIAIWYSMIFCFILGSLQGHILVIKKEINYIMHTSVYITVLMLLMFFVFAKYLTVQEFALIIIFKNFIVLSLRYLRVKDYIHFRHFMNFLVYFIFYLVIFFLYQNQWLNLYAEILLLVFFALDFILFVTKNIKIIKFTIKNV